MRLRKHHIACEPRRGAPPRLRVLSAESAHVLREADLELDGHITAARAALRGDLGGVDAQLREGFHGIALEMRAGGIDAREIPGLGWLCRLWL